jgi:hypothetical protein
MDKEMIAKQLTEVINRTHALCYNGPVDIKILKAHKIAVNNLIRGYKNNKSIPVDDLETAYNQILLKLDSIE